MFLSGEVGRRRPAGEELFTSCSVALHLLLSRTLDQNINTDLQGTDDSIASSFCPLCRCLRSNGWKYARWSREGGMTEGSSPWQWGIMCQIFDTVQNGCAAVTVAIIKIICVEVN
ncbi:hypothetical protein EYF80_055545 [Liparis tanakae]|uniref:Uncharacterized protein n=1 Tax=Liparis tanakae TaxID=230148 RepID=A0A4Z2F1D2_9TELE|nr:hypothetical protein EYF80_055545 [Liparis tanakae]